MNTISQTITTLAPSKQAAIALGAEFVQLHIDHGMRDIRVEVREIEGGYNY